MEKRRFGNTDMDVSVLGFGGSEIGYRNAEPSTVETLLNSAIDAGLNVIDTAECYADSEEKIGAAVAHRREDFFLFTKCGHASGIDLPDWSPELLRQSIDRSLVRLQTDRIDLIQLHSCSQELLERGEVIEVLKEAKQAGKTRYIGYSGDRDDAVYAVELGVFDSLQTSINISDQEILSKALPLAKAKNMGVIAKRPVANVAWAGVGEPRNPYEACYWDRLKKLDYPLLKLPLDEAVSTALRFTLSQPGVSCAIVGTQNPARWASNAAKLDAGPLSAEELKAIRDRWNEVAGPDWVGQT
jgi:aryl-alcohol dehydrogenase-like predicted oxidoreductase